MARVKTGLFYGLLALSTLILPPALKAGDEWRITASRKKCEVTDGKKVMGNTTMVPEGVLYEIKVTNGAFKDAPKTEARYMVFVERQKPATRSSEDVVEKIKGKAAVPALRSRATEAFKTEPVTLWNGSLKGGFYYENGGRIRTKDRLVGIWVKLFEDGNEVGEYVNPTTLASQHEWQE